jgi:hypothetical protein
VQSQSSKVLNSDAPSESEVHCRSPREDIFTFIPDNGARNVSTRSHLQIALKVSPSTHQFICHRLVLKRSNGRRLNDNNVLTQKSGLACTSI